MKNEIYNYDKYKKYLVDRLKSDGRVTHGLRAQVSKFIGCQPSYLSQVLNGKPHLTLDQAIQVNHFFAHRKDEARYFILLWEHERSGTKESRDFFKEQIDELRENRFNLKKRLVSMNEIDLNQQHTYYSTWYFSAIHMILLIPEFQTAQSISRHFNLPMNVVIDVIDFLEKNGLIVSANGKFELTKKRIHLGRDSDFVRSHHINWRSQALQSVEKNFPTDLHYSNVVAISKEDFLKIKEVFIQAIESARSLIGPSKEEALFAISLDVYEI